MKNIILALFINLLIGANFVWAKDAKTESHFKILHVAELAKMLKAKKPLVIYDANVESTRKHVGKIPGAKLLGSSSKYETAKELPADKNSHLVFYCANTECTASHTAAERAFAAGYKNVSVMVDGIYGWQKAGEVLEPVLVSGSRIAPKEALALQSKKQAVIVDVREGEERHEVVPQALWAPMSQMRNDKKWTEFVKTLPKNEVIIFHCATGMRSKNAAEKLQTEGYTTVYFDGPDEWKTAGLPVEKGPAK